jgi:hypothetical protein
VWVTLPVSFLLGQSWCHRPLSHIEDDEAYLDKLCLSDVARFDAHAQSAGTSVVYGEVKILNM